MVPERASRRGRSKLLVFRGLLSPGQGLRPEDPGTALRALADLGDVRSGREHRAHHRRASIPAAPEEGIKRIRRGLGGKDHKLNRAITEILERGHVPSPDRVFEGRVHVSLDRLNLQYGPDLFRRLEDGRYALKLHDKKQGRRPRPRAHAAQAGGAPGRRRRRARQQRRVDVLLLHPAQRRHRHGHAPRRDARDHAGPGLVRPRVRRGRARGRRRRRRAELDAETRSACTPSAARSTRSARWRGTGSRCSSTTAARSRCTTSSTSTIPKTAGQWVILIDPHGNRTLHTDLDADRRPRSGAARRRSSTTRCAGACACPSASIDLAGRGRVRRSGVHHADLEAGVLGGPRARARAACTARNAPASACSSAAASPRTTTSTSFFEAVGKVVRESVERVLPIEPDATTQARNLIASDEREQLHARRRRRADTRARYIKPIREIVDRGGKALALVRGARLLRHRRRRLAQVRPVARAARADARRLADRRRRPGQVRSTRRGGKTAHLIYGEADGDQRRHRRVLHGISTCSTRELISDAQKLRIYELYFEAMRAGHAGQAIDIDGFDEHDAAAWSRAVTRALLEGRVLGVHRLKTAAPAGCLARMGAVAGGGSDAQIERRRPSSSRRSGSRSRSSTTCSTCAASRAT